MEFHFALKEGTYRRYHQWGTAGYDSSVIYTGSLRFDQFKARYGYRDSDD
jgi:hypothetical protein